MGECRKERRSCHIFESLLVFGDSDWVWDVVPATHIDNHDDHFGISKSKQLLQNLLLGANINKSYAFVFNIDNSSGLRNREPRMGKGMFAGDDSDLCVPTSGWMDDSRGFSV